MLNTVISPSRERILNFWRDLPLVGTKECKTTGNEMMQWHLARFESFVIREPERGYNYVFSALDINSNRHEFYVKDTPYNVGVIADLRGNLPEDKRAIFGYGRFERGLPSLDYLSLISPSNGVFEFIFGNGRVPRE